MQPLDLCVARRTFAVNAVPPEQMAGVLPFEQPPLIGDLLLAEVLSLGRHTTIELANGLTQHVFPGSRLIGAFGNRYATDQYEGYIPTSVVAESDLLSVGGVVGDVTSRHASMATPTRLRLLGAVCDPAGRPLNLRRFGLPARLLPASGQTILVVGASMNAGKTTTVGTLARALHGAGKRVVAAKLTGTAAGKDTRYFASCGAEQVLDFTAAGYPSTYMLSLSELLTIYQSLVSQLRALEPDVLLLEIADGIFQRETRMLLECPLLREEVNHVFFAANDSLSAESGARHLRGYNLPLRAICGVLTQSPLGVREAEEVTGLPVLSLDAIMNGAALALIEAAAELTAGIDLLRAA